MSCEAKCLLLRAFQLENVKRYRLTFLVVREEREASLETLKAMIALRYLLLSYIPTLLHKVRVYQLGHWVTTSQTEEEVIQRRKKRNCEATALLDIEFYVCQPAAMRLGDTNALITQNGLGTKLDRLAIDQDREAGEGAKSIPL